MRITCPVCNGNGKIDEPANIRKDLLKEKSKIAKTLRESGYSIREIMRIMNYKSTNSVSLLLRN